MADSTAQSKPFDCLPAWYAYLGERGFDISVQRQTHVGHWLLDALSNGALTTDDQQFLPLLAPLLCRNADEQRRYHHLFVEWRAAVHEGQPPDTQTGSATEGVPKARGARSRGGWVAGGVVAALVASWFTTVLYSRDYCVSVMPMWAAGEVCGLFHPAQTVPDDEPREDGSDLQAASTKPPDPGWTQVAQPLPEIDLRQITSIEEPAERHWLDWLLAWLPLGIISALCGWSWWRRSDILRRSQSAEHERAQRDALRLAAPEALFDAVGGDTAMRALNRPIVVETSRGELDAVKSLQETARQAKPTLAYVPHTRLPEIVVLVQVAGANDLREELAERLQERLVGNGLRTVTYLFTAAPTWLLPLGSNTGERCAPGTLQLRHPNARLLLLAEPARVYDIYVNRLLDWAAFFADWQAPLSLLTLEPFDQALARQLRTDGLQLLPLDAAGFDLLLDARVAASGRARALHLSLNDPEWPTDAALARRRYHTLTQFLSERGMRLLQVLAVYPELNLGLAVALDRQLYPRSERHAREQRLFRLLRLPWARQGWLPDALRLTLITHQSTAERAKASALYRKLFESLGAHGRLRLPFWLPDRWTALRLFLGLRGPGERDFLFLSQVVGPRWLNRLAFYLPNTGKRLAQLGRHYKVVAGLLLVLSGMPVLLLAIHPPSVAVAGGKSVPMSVQLRYAADSESRADSIGEWLERNGANVTRESAPNLEPGTRLRVTPERDPLARQLAEHLRRMPEPDVVQVALDGPVADGVVIEVGNPSDEGRVDVFRDHFASAANQKASESIEFLPAMVPIAAGSFTMGSPANEPKRFSDENPAHPVTVQAFELAETEVTFDQYDAFATEMNRPLPDDEGWGRGNRPVINVSWDDALGYIDWLNAKTGDNYRLPTEAEWEYAARAGTETPFYTGECIFTEQANYDGNFDYNNCGADTGEYRQQTLSVKSFRPNPFALFDMAGNVWEWTQDCWHDDYTNAPDDGSAWLESDGGNCDRRVLRGGGWDFLPENLRSANRSRYFRDFAGSNVGFRLARTASPSAL